MEPRGSEQTLSLSSEHDKTVTKAFKYLWNDKHFTDVTLQTEDGQQMSAHKTVLVSCSYFFRKLLLGHTESKTTVICQDLLYSEITLVVQFIYLGYCHVQTSQMERFLENGTNLGIHSIMKIVGETDDLVIAHDTPSEIEANSEYLEETVIIQGNDEPDVNVGSQGNCALPYHFENKINEELNNETIENDLNKKYQCAKWVQSYPPLS